MAWLYRYVSNAERASIESSGIIQSTSGVTYFAIDPPSRYETREDVRDLLATPGDKSWAVGPIPDAWVPLWDVVAPRTVTPQKLGDGTWVPGGGTEAATSHVVRLFGIRLLR